jgi:hypothetical protein
MTFKVIMQRSFMSIDFQFKNKSRSRSAFQSRSKSAQTSQSRSSKRIIKSLKAAQSKSLLASAFREFFL